MRIPVPKSSLLTLALVGAVLTGALTVGLANPDAVAGLRHDASALLPMDADDQYAASSVSGSRPAVTPAATAVTATTQSPTTPAPAASSASESTASPSPTPAPTATPTPAATPTPVPNFTPEVQTVVAGRTGGDDDHEYEDDEYDHDEHDEHEDD